MNLIDFPEAHIVIAENQPEYLPMPAYEWDGRTITCCWNLSFYERLRVLFTGRIWHSVWTFGKSLQPQQLQVTKPEMQMCEARIQQRKVRMTILLRNEETLKARKDKSK